MNSCGKIWRQHSSTRQGQRPGALPIIPPRSRPALIAAICWARALTQPPLLETLAGLEADISAGQERTRRLQARPFLFARHVTSAGAYLVSGSTKADPLQGRRSSPPTREDQVMKIVVIGGTGLIGSKTVERLRKRGHEVVAASPNSGVNTLTGEGLDQALAGAEVVIDLANSPSFEDKAALRLLRDRRQEPLGRREAAGVKHHIALSVVGIRPAAGQRLFRAKQAQEDLIRASRRALLHRPLHPVLRVHGRHRPVGAWKAAWCTCPRPRCSRSRPTTSPTPRPRWPWARRSAA